MVKVVNCDIYMYKYIYDFLVIYKKWRLICIMYLKLVYKRIYKLNLFKMKNIFWEICILIMVKFYVVKFFILKFIDLNVDYKN